MLSQGDYNGHSRQQTQKKKCVYVLQAFALTIKPNLCPKKISINPPVFHIHYQLLTILALHLQPPLAPQTITFHHILAAVKNGSYSDILRKLKYNKFIAVKATKVPVLYENSSPDTKCNINKRLFRVLYDTKAQYRHCQHTRQNPQNTKRTSLSPFRSHYFILAKIMLHEMEMMNTKRLCCHTVCLLVNTAPFLLAQYSSTIITKMFCKTHHLGGNPTYMSFISIRGTDSETAKRARKRRPRREELERIH